ncbi:HD-GYP domain-containing protein [Natranaerofaba carboxydovora]|uniref:HD-GYP domain-containing protein n=1 Tax=Natranaerofaba carboxydovora TaxID=2742683 RepID=UPI001F145B08|nr:HD-GYP domain-containing protein [Natranaerofaba carboxydovora]UMZ74461.1 Cyclic di-GMP phosphodiesterase response regulator RpfG [Natranaerofaba carboxydovora]
MPTYKVSELTPGMKLGQDIVSSQGVTLIPIDTILNEKIISYIRSWRFEKVVIKKEEKEVQQERQQEYEEFKESYNKSLDSVKSLFDGVKKGDNIPAKEVETLGDELLGYSESFFNLKLINQLKRKDSYTYQHGMNVGIYSAMLGRWLGVSDENQQILMIAGLLHDIGKYHVPDNILKKPGPLNKEEFAEIKKHTVYGYEILNEAEELKEKYGSSITVSALQHHEKRDGSGYPKGIKGSEINPIAKIVAVADIFDAMTSNRVYKSKDSPFKAVEQLHDDSFHKLDPKAARTFLEKISDMFVGASVVLDNDEIGEIVMLNMHSLTRPLIRVGETFKDLSQDYSVNIVDMIFT